MPQPSGPLPAGRALRILLVCTRDPGGRRSGRKTVLLTIVNSLRAIGHEVEIAVLARGSLQTAPVSIRDVKLWRMSTPGPALAVLNVLRYFTRRRLSLNECLFTSHRGTTELARRIAERDYDLIVADMIRAAPLVIGQDTPFVIDLDDRLSDRYREIADSAGDSSALLGYYADWLPRPTRRAAMVVARRLLAREAAVLRQREVDVARLASGVSLVASDEAASLATEVDRQVFALPMAVEIPATAAQVELNPGSSMAFLGGLDYHANLEAVRWFAAELLPALRESIPGFTLQVVGFCPDPVRRELGQPGLRFTGYVQQPISELARHRAFLAPLVSGRGIKTKVLEAMALGLPVVSTPVGLTGITPPAGACLCADSAATFVSSVLELSENADSAKRIGAAGRLYVAENFSPYALQQKWRAMLTYVCDNSRDQQSGIATGRYG